jgi:hypothetical protein
MSIDDESLGLDHGDLHPRFSCPTWSGTLEPHSPGSNKAHSIGHGNSILDTLLNGDELMRRLVMLR